MARAVVQTSDANDLAEHLRAVLDGVPRRTRPFHRSEVGPTVPWARLDRVVALQVNGRPGRAATG